MITGGGEKKIDVFHFFFRPVACLTNIRFGRSRIRANSNITPRGLVDDTDMVLLVIVYYQYDTKGTVSEQRLALSTALRVKMHNRGFPRPIDVCVSRL
jgi:hypothetical protein